MGDRAEKQLLGRGVLEANKTVVAVRDLTDEKAYCQYCCVVHDYNLVRLQFIVSTTVFDDDDLVRLQLIVSFSTTVFDDDELVSWQLIVIATAWVLFDVEHVERNCRKAL